MSTSTRRTSADSSMRPLGRRGFTLIEMVVVVAIVGILAAAAQPLMALQSRRQKELELRHNLRLLRGALDAYKQSVIDGKVPPSVGTTGNDSGYPPDLQTLVEGVSSMPAKDSAASNTEAKSSSVPTRVYFLRRMPRDPFADPSVPASQTWGLRSYDSPPDAPQPGRDVYDVYSRTEGVGLNGTPYRGW